MPNLLDRLPLHFRILYQQFLLRVVDLESLSIKADMTAFLGQFAGVLIMFSFILSGKVYIDPIQTEQTLISTTMLVVGLIIVISWDATFPDRRDILVLAPLPVAPRTILTAKVAASTVVLGLAVLALNVTPSIVSVLCLETTYGFLRTFAAYWVATLASVIFLYASVLTLQGLTALLLPRRIFLRLSAFLQILAFAYFLCSYFMQPSLPTVAMALPASHHLLAWSPSFWFYALCVQINGVLPTSLTWLAQRAWIALVASTLGASASLLLCYVRTLRKTVEEPDLITAGQGAHWTLRFGSQLQTAVILFCFRSLSRSRQHRVAFAFYLAIVSAIALSTTQSGIAQPAPQPLTPDFLLATLMMMSFAVIGLRSVFSLPISLNANWVLRTTQLRPTHEYTAATRSSLILLSVLPITILAAILSSTFRPIHQTAAHLIILFLMGLILADTSLVGFYKIPFTCSYLPGKSNIQFIFWAFLILFIPLAMQFVSLEQKTFNSLPKFLCMITTLLVLLAALRAFNRHEAKSAAIYFEELPPELITRLNLSGLS